MAGRRFPIFSFPPNVAERILGYVPMAELFEISLLSKRAYALVQNSSISYPKNCEFDVELSDSSSVTAYRNRFHKTIEWHFYGKRDSGRHELEDVETRTVKVSNGESGALVFAKLTEKCYGSSANSIQDVLQFVQYIAALFGDIYFRLNIEPDYFQHLEAIQSVEALRKSKQVYVTKGTVSHVEMVQILEGFEPDLIKMSCDPGANFTYDRPISIRKFVTYTGSWLKGPMLLNLICEQVTVVNADVTEEDIIAFLDRQLENRDGCGNMKTALFFREPSDRDFVYDNRIKKAWDSEKITNALSSYEQEDPEIRRHNSKRLWKENRTNFIDVVTVPERDPSYLALVKDMNILEANATLFPIE